ncbi:MAG: hypothetical protein JXQ73_29790 [Phycisphaerae bacterium]|nr:hypothetical protein [Phycisphaerae bacterium]
MNGHYIAAPAAGRDRQDWLAKLREYRRTIRQDGLGQIINMNYQGVRAWVRLAPTVARALDLKPRDEVRVEVETCWLAGNGDRCATIGFRCVVDAE